VKRWSKATMLSHASRVKTNNFFRHWFHQWIIWPLRVKRWSKVVSHRGGQTLWHPPTVGFLQPFLKSGS
jgi:hypothetical protein